MVQQFVLVALVCFAGLAAAQTHQAYPTHLYPVEHRDYRGVRGLVDEGIRPIAELPSPTAYEFHVVPASAVAEYDINTDLSIWDYIPSPITVLSCIGSKALSAVKWILAKAPLIILGMALVIGFCAFTPYCTLIIEKPFTRKIKSFNIPYLDDVEHLLKQAYNKYTAMQYER